MAAASISNFENRWPSLYFWTDLLQRWWECWESDIQRNCRIKSAYFGQIWKWRPPTSRISKICCNLSTIEPILTKFGENVEILTAKSRTHFHQKSRWRSPPSWISKIFCHHFTIESILTKFDGNVNKLPWNVAVISKMLILWNSRRCPPPSRISKIGGHRFTIGPIFTKFDGMLRIRHRAHNATVISKMHDLAKLKMAATAILNLENLLQFLNNWTNPHQIRCECWESDIERNCHIKKAYLSKFKDGGCRNLEFRKSVSMSSLLNQSPPNLVTMLRIWQRTPQSCQKYIFTKIQDGGCRYLDSRKNCCHCFSIRLILAKFGGNVANRNCFVKNS